MLIYISTVSYSEFSLVIYLLMAHCYVHQLLKSGNLRMAASFAVGVSKVILVSQVGEWG